MRSGEGDERSDELKSRDHVFSNVTNTSLFATRFARRRSQSQGIAFGRQMLLEHKLHATKLQSEVSVLTQEKVKTEEHIESLLDEISEFEEGVKTLEKEMHQLSKIQTESEGVLDEEAKLFFVVGRE